jgi:hypothetical protein
VLGRIFGSKRDIVTGGRRKLHSVEFCNNSYVPGRGRGFASRIEQNGCGSHSEFYPVGLEDPLQGIKRPGVKLIILSFWRRR